jgi:putative addiction module component (TIGR02574 family)
MEIPKAGSQHERLRALVGSWKGDEKMYPSPWDSQGGTAKGFTEARFDLDGMFVIADYRQERNGKVTYRGHGVFGWDAKQSAYTTKSARAALAARLLESLDSEIDEDAEEAWDAEIARRLDEIDSGRVKMIPWSEARRQIMETSGGRQKR